MTPAGLTATSNVASNIPKGCHVASRLLTSDVLVFTGLPGSGKSTVSERMADELDSPAFSPWLCDRLIWPRCDGLKWPHLKEAGVFVTV